MDRPTLADDFMRAVAVVIADALIRLAHDNSEWGAWAGPSGFTSDLLQHDDVPVVVKGCPGRSGQELFGEIENSRAFTRISSSGLFRNPANC
jgi:hypothetical protein